MLAPAPLRGLLAALVFLTRLPVGQRGYRPDDWRWASGWFPAVGILVGALQAGLWLTLAPYFGPTTLALFALALGLAVTGALHEDGLADTADALWGSHDRQRLFEILKDSRLGTFGVAALALSVLTRVSLLTELGAEAPAALIATGALARTAPVWLMATLPYVTPHGAKSSPVMDAGPAQVGWATLWGGLPMAALIAWNHWPSSVFAAPISLAVLGAFCAFRFRRRAGGLTGDFLGALEQLGEIGVLAVLTIAFRLG